MFLKVGEAAKLLKVSPATIAECIRTKRLRAVNVSCNPSRRPQWRIHPEDLRDIKPLEPARKTRRMTSGLVDF